MSRISKTFALLLSLLIAMSCVTLLMVNPANAQTIPKPSVPEFSLKVVAYPYYTTPTTTIDPYSGQNTTTQNGYQVENKSIEIIIKNQPFSQYMDSTGNRINLFYNITVKGHFGNTWNYAYNNPYRGLLNASDSDYTIISMPIGHHSTVPSGGYPLEGIDTGDSVDFQVQAQIGYYTIYSTGMFAGIIGGAMDFYYIFAGQTSGWSNTQTIAITATSISTSSSPTAIPTNTLSPAPSPTVPELSWLAIVPLLLSVFCIAVIVKHRKDTHE
jgi:hypothetical protein